MQCPLCGNAHIRKGLSAPRLNLRSSSDAGSQASQPTQPVQATNGAVTPQAMHAAWLHMARQIVARTEDVGQRFAVEARRMHYGEIEERPIRGQASPGETAELLDEGIAVLPLLLPDAATESLQ